jgi:hypothetical protein
MQHEKSEIEESISKPESQAQDPKVIQTKAATVLGLPVQVRRKSMLKRIEVMNYKAHGILGESDPIQDKQADDGCCIIS